MGATRRELIATGAAAVIGSSPLFDASAKRKRVLRIAHITDLHVQPERAAALGMERCLEAAQGEKPDILFMGGDAIMDSLAADLPRVKAQWDLYLSVLRANTKLPTIHALGNHDVWGWGARQKFEQEPLFGKAYALERLEMARAYHRFERAGWRVIVLDSTFPVPGDGYTARLDDEQFAWLESEIKGTTLPVLVLSHIPIVAACPFFHGDNEKTGNWNVPGAWMHLDARRIKALFRAHPNVKACLSGHMHLVDAVRYAGVEYFCNGAGCGGWWGGAFQEFDNGYGITDLFNDGTVENRFVEYAWTPQP